MKLKLHNQIAAAASNERGASLVEALAVLVLTVMVTGLLTYVLNFANASLQQVSAREEALQESRDIVQHVTASVRQPGFMPAGLMPADAAPRSLSASPRLYLVHERTGETIDYIFNQTERTLTVERRGGGETATLRHIFSGPIDNVVFAAEQQHLRGPIRYTVSLDIRLPNNQIRQTTTTILSSDRQ